MDVPTIYRTWFKIIVLSFYLYIVLTVNISAETSMHRSGVDRIFESELGLSKCFKTKLAINSIRLELSLPTFEYLVYLVFFYAPLCFTKNIADPYI